MLGKNNLIGNIQNKSVKFDLDFKIVEVWDLFFYIFKKILDKMVDSYLICYSFLFIHLFF